MDTALYEKRPGRFQTDLLISVQLNPWNPFSIKKAKLLDVSWSGFKIQFLDEVKLKDNQIIQLIFPLTGLNISENKKFKIPAMIRWYDALNKKIGGVYIIPKDNNNELLGKLVSALAQKIETEQK